MSVRKLDLSSILGRVMFATRQITGDSGANSGAVQPNEIPDPMTLVETADKAGLSLAWLLYGVRDQDSGQETPKQLNTTHPPPVNLILQQPQMVMLRELLDGPILTKFVREVIADRIPDGTIDKSAESIADLAAARARIQCLYRRDYINASGIIIHTGWGNAPLSAAAYERLMEGTGATPTGAADTQSRTEACGRMLCALTGAKSATVTTSNAASLLLTGGALAAGMEILVAARDLIEISEGVRIGGIIEASGARIVPVGAANCVELEDFRRSITPATGMILRSHASNVVTTGYARHVPDGDLGKLAHDYGLAYVVNLGGGSLVDVTERGLPECPTVSQAITDGADLVLASGDKIISGPQAGIIAGKKDLIGQLGRHPLARTCRPGKLTLAALEGTLAQYLAGRAWEEIPTLRLLGMGLPLIRERSRSLAEGLRARGYEAVDAEDHAQCGGAVMPGVDLPTWTVRIRHPKFSAEELYALLLARRVVGRRGQDAVILDLRSVPPEEDPRLHEALGLVPL